MKVISLNTDDLIFNETEKIVAVMKKPRKNLKIILDSDAGLEKKWIFLQKLLYSSYEKSDHIWRGDAAPGSTRI
jgi:hypothetical protein